LVAYYPFEGNVNDMSGNGNNGWSNDCNYVSSKLSSGISLNGVNSSVSIPDSDLLDFTSEYSISMWIYRRTDSKNFERILSKSDFSGYTYWLQIDPDSTIEFGNGPYIKSNITIPINTWIHVFAIKNSTGFSLYFNGISDKKAQTFGEIKDATVTDFPLNLGRLGTSNNWYYGFDGVIDELKIWNYQLTKEEILNEYNIGVCDNIIVPISDPVNINYPLVGNYIGGSNYVYIDIGKIKETCNINDFYNEGEVKPVVGYYHVCKDKVREQLEALNKSGQRKISLVLWFSHFDNSLRKYQDYDFKMWRVVANSVLSDGGKITPQQEDNLRNIIRDIRSIGFDSVFFRFAGQIQSDPTHPSFQQLDLYSENWNFIKNTREIVNEEWCNNKENCNGNGLLYDLGVEFSGAGAGKYPEYSSYTTQLWRDYVNSYGKNDTVGFSHSYGDQSTNSAPGVNKTSYNNMLDLSIENYDASDVGRPNFYAFDLYDENYDLFMLIDSKFKEKGIISESIIISETYANSKNTGLNFSKAINESKREVLYLLQWPLLKPNCPDAFIDVSYNYSNYLDFNLRIEDTCILSECIDNNPCTTESCVNGVCNSSFNVNVCDDTNSCTLNDLCSNGVCSGTLLNCDDFDSCTNDNCINGACIYDFIESESCTCDSDIECYDNNYCTNDSCINHQCSFINNSNSCNDNFPCTVNDICSNGNCNGVNKDCNDNIAYTIDSCESGNCMHVFNGTCTNDSICEDGSICTDNFCNNVTARCEVEYNDDSCNDDDLNTINDECIEGSCIGESICNLNLLCEGGRGESCSNCFSDCGVCSIGDGGSGGSGEGRNRIINTSSWNINLSSNTSAEIRMSMPSNNPVKNENNLSIVQKLKNEISINENALKIFIAIVAIIIILIMIFVYFLVRNIK